jgi:ABC-type transport system involved in multi-copper enzyme maturation permease subunit
VSGLLRAEFLKLRKRWMLYVLFILMLAGAAILIWLMGYVSWKSDDVEYRPDALRTFAYPFSVAAMLDTGQFWGSAIFVAILTTSTLATEHNWGTVRPSIAGGVSRASYLLTKLLTLTLVSTVALLLVFGFGLLMSLWATSAAGYHAPVPHPGSFTAGDFALMVARTALCIVPYGLLAFALTVVTRSTAVGIAGTMVYMILEAIFVAVLGTGGDLMQNGRFIFLDHSVTALIAENRFDGLSYNAMWFRDLDSESQPGVWTAAAIVVFQSALFLAASFAVFLRRDVTVSQG